jgi:hypothetical protein
MLHNIAVLDLRPTYIFPSRGTPPAIKHPYGGLTDLHRVTLKYSSSATNRKSSFVVPPCWAGHIYLPMPTGLRNVGHSPTVAPISPAPCNDVIEVISDHRSYEMLDPLQHCHLLHQQGCPHHLHSLVNGGTEHLELFLTGSCESVHVNRKELCYGLRFLSFRTNSQPPERIPNCFSPLNPIHHPR